MPTCDISVARQYLIRRAETLPLYPWLLTGQGAVRRLDIKAFGFGG
ncbi:MAG: hypothetical protein KAS36_12455 [Anaerolineales bacterium]|nr:hypothetical protein [Anaerolineales bacterium]